MKVKNLDSGIDWTDKVSSVSKAFPIDLSVLGNKHPVTRPVSMFLVSVQTMNDILNFPESNPQSYFLEYGKLRELSGKSNVEIEKILQSQGTIDIDPGQPGLATWGHHWLIKYLRVNHGLVVNQRDPLVFLCPEAIRNRLAYVESYFKRTLRVNRHIGHIRDRIVQCVIWHEMAHICFERVDMPWEARLSEGLANATTYLLADNLCKEVLNTMACSPKIDFRRNYYHLLRYYGPHLDSIASSYLLGNRGEAHAKFAQLRLLAEKFDAVETDGGALRIGGEITGKPDKPWLAYGAKKKSISVATELPFLCNIKSGFIVAPRIGNIVGYLNENTKVITHEIGHHDYSKLPTNIRVLQKEEADIGQVVREEILTGKITEESFINQFN